MYLFMFIVQALKIYYLIFFQMVFLYMSRFQIIKFIKRFWKDPYKNEERKWMSKLVEARRIRVKSKFTELQKLL